jgi:hypothetical protein
MISLVLALFLWQAYPSPPPPELTHQTIKKQLGLKPEQEGPLFQVLDGEVTRVNQIIDGPGTAAEKIQKLDALHNADAAKLKQPLDPAQYTKLRTLLQSYEAMAVAHQSQQAAQPQLTPQPAAPAQAKPKSKPPQ